MEDLQSISGMGFFSVGDTPETPAIEGKINAFPQIPNSGNTANPHHDKLLKTIRSKQSALRKSKNLFIRIPFDVLVLSKISHDDPNSNSFEVIGKTGEIITVSSPNKKLINITKCSLIESTKVMRNHMKPIKTPKQMAKEWGW